MRSDPPERTGSALPSGRPNGSRRAGRAKAQRRAIALASALALGAALAACGHHAAVSPPASATPCALDASLDQAQCAAVQQLLLPEALPVALGNHHADSVDAAVLGHQAFFDARFSGSQQMRCATCHTPERAFQDGLPVPEVGRVARKTPTMLNAARLRPLFWDGRADSAWAQPLDVLESHSEMDFTRLEIVHLLQRSYGARYTAAFGALPDFSDASRFPARGAPGDAAYDAMAAADKLLVDTTVSNLGKAFEAYLRKLAAGRSPLDRYLAGDALALTASQKRGLAVFAQAGCTACHSGPMLSDQSFHNLGVPAAPGREPDPGRLLGAPQLVQSPFNLRGSFSDDPPADAKGPMYQSTPADLGAFRTPSLRNLSRAAPYGHNGTFATLGDAVDFHLKGGGRGQQGFAGAVDPLLQPRTLAADDRSSLLDFLSALDGDYPRLPWNNWPDG